MTNDIRKWQLRIHDWTVGTLAVALLVGILIARCWP